MQSILDHNTIFLPIILDLKHNENSFQNLTRNMKSFKNVIEKEKRNNVFLSQTADMAVIEFNQTFFMKEKLVHLNTFLDICSFCTNVSIALFTEKN